MKPIIIAKVGDTFPALVAEKGDFEDWIRLGLSAGACPVRTADARREPLPSIDAIAGAVVTGSHSMVTDREEWSERAAEWLREGVEREVPVLGICYGHQLLAHALGGEVGYRPDGMEAGTVRVLRTEAARTDRLFKALPAEFPAHAVHRQSVLRLPRDAVVLARNAFEAHHAFRAGESAWGVQFHPEFEHEVMIAYLDHLDPDTLLASGSIASLRAAVAPTVAAARLLRRFGAIVRSA